MTNPENWTHMFFAFRDGLPISAAWEISPKETKKFYREHAGLEIRRVEGRTPEAKELIDKMWEI